MLRQIVRECREFPATVLFCVGWIVVFAAMIAFSYQDGRPPTLSGLLLTGFGEGRRFGDLTLMDLANGQYWRLMTCNFVHYSVIHIGMNLFAFYLLGSLLESWYGSWTLAAIYGMTGVGGNLLSALARQAMGSNPLVHSGGGSVVIMGLIGLCATAGWVSRTDRDRELTWQMLKALVMTGALGLIFPRYIDNWGHAGGAVAGLPIGLAHHRLLKGRGRPWTLGFGAAWMLVLAVSVGAQFVADRAEEQVRTLVRSREEARAYANAHVVLRVVQQWTRSGGDARNLVHLLESQKGILDLEPTREVYRRLLPLAAELAQGPILPPKLEDFRRDLDALTHQIKTDAETRLKSYWQARRQEPHPSPRSWSPPTVPPLVKPAPKSAARHRDAGA